MISIELYDEIDIKNLEFLGSGTQGSVYKLDNSKCIKIFRKKSSCSDELHSLLITQSSSYFPKLYSYGDKYIVREYINGTPLDKYLSDKPLTDYIKQKIMDIYTEMKYVGFNRLDCALFHIFITNSGDFKLIDTAKAMKKKYSYPRIILKGLYDLNYKDEFLLYVQKHYKNIYNTWQNENKTLKAKNLAIVNH